MWEMFCSKEAENQLVVGVCFNQFNGVIHALLYGIYSLQVQLN